MTTANTSPANAPALTLPPGFVAVPQEDGTIKVQRADGGLARTIAFRVTTAEYNAIRPFCDSFPAGQWAEAMRWLFDQPAVRDVMAARIRSVTTPA